VLKASGFSVTTCESAVDALKMFDEGRKFDVVVSDIEMPGMNGFEFAETLKRSPRHRNIPILALSAITTPASIERGRQAGFDDYIAKFDRAGLIAALKEVTTYEMGVAA
jgi:two-component system chemotaxis sensor kinase CheA